MYCGDTHIVCRLNFKCSIEWKCSLFLLGVSELDNLFGRVVIFWRFFGGTIDYRGYLNCDKSYEKSWLCGLDCYKNHPNYLENGAIFQIVKIQERSPILLAKISPVTT
jgi:hypothetical protein